MLKLALGVLGVLCCGVAGCADLRLRQTVSSQTVLSQDAAPAVPAVNQPDPLYLAEQAAYIAEYTPWRVQARRRAVEQLTPREADHYLNWRPNVCWSRVRRGSLSCSSAGARRTRR
jgi:hypothetical protein